MFIIPREAYDIDYDDTRMLCSIFIIYFMCWCILFTFLVVPKELVDQFNTENSLDFTFEEIMQLNVDYAMAKKTAFRHDAFMFHQANLRMFPYIDPFATMRTSNYTSLTTLWMQMLLEQLMAVYDLPSRHFIICGRSAFAN